MKNLELSDLENISGGNDWYTGGKQIFSVVVSAGVLVLQSIVVSMLTGYTAEGQQCFLYEEQQCSTFNETFS